MMTLTFKRTGWLAGLYRFTFNDEPPANLCPYFWATLFGLMFFPFSWLSYPWRMKDWYGFWQRFGYTLLSWMFVSAIAILSFLTATRFYDVLAVVLILLGVMVGMLILFGLGVLFTEYAPGPTRRAYDAITTSEPVRLAKGFTSSVKENWCPKITWVD